MARRDLPEKRQYCEAQKKEHRGGGTCKARAGQGTDHLGYGFCKNHGGNTPAGKTHVREAQATDAALKWGIPREVDPHTALIEELHRTAGLVTFYGYMAEQLATDDLHGPVGGGQWSIPKHEAHIWVRLHQEERDRYARIAKTCVDVGIEERQIRLAEEQGRILANKVRDMLSELGIDMKNPDVQDIIRRHLTS